MVLICYDGSPDAKAAVEHGAEFLRGVPVTVLTVWEPYTQVTSHSAAGFGLAPGVVDTTEIDDVMRTNAQTRAEEGAELAREAGLDAHARARSGISVASTILAEAQDTGASAIMIGSRGLGGVKSLLLGSVSHAVLHHADRPVIVVPSRDVASARERHREADGNRE
jgi:nucleotide-binding universal stress UspA family protein